MDEITVVVADGDGAKRALFSATLDDQPDLTIVGRASSGVTAVEQILDLMPDVAVCSTDLPDADGVDTCRAVIDRAPAACIVLVAGQSELRRAYEGILAGAVSCVSLESAAHDLAAATRAANRRESMLPPPIAGQILRDMEAVGGRDAATLGRPTLTATEREVLTRLAHGEAPREIARRYDVTPRLVNVHTGYAVAKLHRALEDVQASTPALATAS